MIMAYFTYLQGCKVAKFAKFPDNIELQMIDGLYKFAKWLQSLQSSYKKMDREKNMVVETDELVIA